MKQERLLKNDILNILSNKISGGAVGDIYGVDMDELGSKKYFKLPKRIVANQPPKLFNDKDLKVEVETRFKSRWDELWKDDIISEDYDEDRPGDFLWSYYIENRDGRPVFTDSSGRSRDMTPIQPLVSVRLDEPIYQDIDRLNLNPTYSTIDPPKLAKKNYAQRLVIDPKDRTKPNKYYPNRFFGLGLCGGSAGDVWSGSALDEDTGEELKYYFKELKDKKKVPKFYQDIELKKPLSKDDSEGLKEIWVDTVSSMDMDQLFDLAKAKKKAKAKAKAKAKKPATHKMPDGAIHTGKKHTKDSKVVKPAPKAKAPKKAPKKQAKTAPPISVSKTGKITKQNAWIQHVKEYRFNNNVEGMSVAQVNKEARKTYTPVSKAKKSPAKKAPAKKAPAKKAPAKKSKAKKSTAINEDEDLEKRILKFVGEQEIENSKPKDCGPKREVNPKTNRCKKLVKSQKNKRQPTAWDLHLRKVRSENPLVKGKDVMKLAKESYKKPNSNRNSLPIISSSDIKELNKPLPRRIEIEEDSEDEEDDIEPSKETNQILADVLEQFEYYDQEYENVFNANMSMSDKQERFDEIKSRVENYKVEIMQEYFDQLDNLSLNRIKESYEDTNKNYNIYFNKVSSGVPENKVELDSEDIIEEIIEDSLAVGEDPLFNKDFSYKPPPDFSDEDENITIEITPKLQTNASIYPNDSILEFSSIDIDPDEDTGPLIPFKNKKDIPLNLRLYQNFVKIMKKNNPELSRKEISEYWKMNKEAFIEMLMLTVEKSGGNLLNEDNYINMFKFLGGELMYGGGLSLFDGLDNYSEQSKPTSDDLSDPQNWLNTFENIGTSVADTVGDIFGFIF